MKDEVEKILLRLESQAWAHIDNSDRVETALSKILALQDKAQVEAVRAARIDELERIPIPADISDITDYEKWIQDRLSSLKEDGETK